MAMEDEEQAKEIPLATAQPVHAHLGGAQISPFFSQNFPCWSGERNFPKFTMT